MFRGRVEMLLAVSFGVLAVLTAAWPDWIEGIFGVDPDGGNGSLEWGLVAVCALIAVVAAVLARRDLRAVRT